MKERPILFSGPMVRAILDDRKTQTRRVINLDMRGVRLNPNAIAFTRSKHAPQFWYIHEKNGSPTNGLFAELPCPYGQPCDRLWVRETWGVGRWGDRIKPSELKGRAEKAGTFATFYQATDAKTKAVKRWRPSIHMPRTHCRLVLDVTDVRVERLQDITEEDAIAEGVDAVSLADAPRQATWSRRQDFAQLWDSLNKKRGFGWDVNPWVWVIGLKPTVDGDRQ